MSKKHDFIAGKQNDRRDNGKVFIDQAAIDGTSFGLTAGEVTDATTKWGTFNTEVGNSQVAKAAMQSQTQTTIAADDAFTATERRLAKKMKLSGGYTPAVGERYKIIGSEFTVDVQNAKPVIKAGKVPTGWQLDFNLLNYFDGVKIFRKRPTEANFSYLATDTSAPYIDTDAQVDGTKYIAYFMIGDEAVGQPSDEVTISVNV